MKKTMFHHAAAVLTLAIFLAMPLQIVIADGEGEGIEKEINGYHVRLVFDEAPKMGENDFHVQITDSMGMPVTNAEVEAIAILERNVSGHDEDVDSDVHGSESMSGMDMPTEAPASEDMNGMSGMDMGTEPEANVTNANTHDEPQDVHAEEPNQVALASTHEAGKYSGTISLDQSGDCTLNIHFTVDGEMNEVEFPVTVVGLDAKYGILAGFIGINISVISAAAITKRKVISTKA
jgi:hypothetical protein